MLQHILALWAQHGIQVARREPLTGDTWWVQVVLPTSAGTTGPQEQVGELQAISSHRTGNLSPQS